MIPSNIEFSRTKPVVAISFLNFADSNKRLTLALILVNSLLFFLVNLVIGEGALIMLTQNNYAIFELGQSWRVFTANWMHADIFHLFSNMIGLLLFGVGLETALRKWQYLLLYVVSGLVGNIASLALSDYYIHSLGASGCVFGVIAASFVVNRKYDPAAVGLGIIYSMLFVILSIGPQIDTWAHIFGALGGIILGYKFAPQAPEEKFKDVY